MPIGSKSIKRATESVKEADTAKTIVKTETKEIDTAETEIKAKEEDIAKAGAKEQAACKANTAKTTGQAASKPVAKKKTSKAAATKTADKPASEPERKVKSAVLTGANPDIKFYHISDDLPDYLL